ncbi:MAG: beta-ketoacyl-ACP synthase III [Phycisphaerales bacterium JB038]
MTQSQRTPGGHTTRGVEILGVGSAVPDRVLTNHDLEKLIDTSDEWIVQRTGVRERRIVSEDDPTPAIDLSTEALTSALQDAGLEAADIDLLIVGTVTAGMSCPSTACRVADRAGMVSTAAFDVSAACCGYIYGLNLAESLIASGRYERIAVIGVDILSRIVEYNERGRGTCILFGDAAGAIIVGPSDDPSKGCLTQKMYADGRAWDLLYIPHHDTDHPEGTDITGKPVGKLQMKGREVFKFAVSRFSDIVGETLEQAGLGVEDVDMFIPHQSNLRIIEAARRRFGIPHDQIYVNIDRYGNSSAGSVGLCLDELWQAGRVKRGDRIMFVAFGGGMTWASSLWQL